jgi:uncharacterized protein (DUF4415 family)
MSISKKRIKKLKAIKDKEIDCSDTPELGANFWKKAKLIKPENKIPVSIRIDQDIYNWFRARGKGYQTMINSVLKTYVNAKQRTT